MVESKYTIPPRTAIAALMASITLIEVVTLLEDLTTRANMPISIVKAAVAPARLSGSIKDSAATAAAITPIAIVIAISVSLQSLAYFVTTISPAIIAERRPTATIPLARPSMSIRLRTMATPASIAMAADIARSVPDILGTSLLAIFII